MRLKSVFIMMETETGFMAFTSDKDSFHGVIRLNASAGKVFELLIEDTSIKEMEAVISETFNTDKETADAVIFKCADVLDKAGLIVYDGDRPENGNVPDELIPVVEFMPQDNDDNNYADMNTGCYYNFSGCFSYDDCWDKNK